MDSFQDLDQLMSTFGLTDNSIVPDSTCESDEEDVCDGCDENEINVDTRMQNFFIATPITENVNAEHCDHEVDNDDPQSDLKQIEQVYHKGCGCLKSCFEQLTFKQIEQNILNMREISKSEKDLVIMATLKKYGIDSRCRSGERKRTRYEYVFDGFTICHFAFMLVYDVKEKTLKNIMAHMKENGIEPRVHGHVGRKAPNSFSHETIKDVVQYLLNLSSEIGLPQPAPLRGRDEEPPIYLPASNSKLSIHKEYVSTCSANNKPRVGLTTFKDVWNKCVPHIKIKSPKEDVCRMCEELGQEVMLARGEEDKLSATEKFRGHVLHAQTERAMYNTCVESSTNMFKLMEENQGVLENYDNVHYTFDFSQYVKLPHHSREKGPTFFIQPRKVQIFGFRIDGHKQLNYLIDEDETIGHDGQLVHGPDSVISMLDHALTEFSIGENECKIHADNCYEQNKNRYVLAYLSWRTMVGKHKHITYMMQLPGHTRCLIDAGFGTIKQLYRRSDCDTLQHVADVVKLSSKSNVPVLYKENGWVWREWKMFFFDRFKKVPKISKYHHFRFTSADPGAVYMKVAADDTQEVRFVICKTNQLDMVVELPETLTQRGLSQERQAYLYKHVRPLVRRQYQDIFCSAPMEQ